MTYYVPMVTSPPPRRPVGRPPKDDPVLDRVRLLQAAAHAFGQGYASMSVRSVARTLGVSQSAVQYHARTKQDLLYAVIDELMIPTLTATQAHTVLLDKRSPDDFRSLVRRRLDALIEHGVLVAAVLSDTSPGADARRARLLTALVPERERGLAAVRSMTERGIIRPVSGTTWTVLVAFAIPAIARAWPLLGHLPAQRDAQLTAVLDELADVLVYGLLPRPQRVGTNRSFDTPTQTIQPRRDDGTATRGSGTWPTTTG